VIRIGEGKQLGGTSREVLVFLHDKVSAVRSKVVMLPIENSDREGQLGVAQPITGTQWVVREAAELELESYGFLGITASQNHMPHVVGDNFLVAIWPSFEVFTDNLVDEVLLQPERELSSNHQWGL